MDKLSRLIERPAIDSVFELCGALLRFAGMRAPELRDGLSTDHADRNRRFVTEAFERVERDWSYSDVAPEVFRALVARGQALGLSAPVIAYQLAQALGTVHQAQFPAGFAGMETPRYEDDPVPVPRPYDWRPFLKRVGSLTKNIGDEHDGCPGLRLARGLSGRTLVVDGRARDALVSFAQNPVVAAAVPNVRPAEELCWDQDPALGRFWNVRPRDPLVQEKMLDAMLTMAVRAGAQVLVYPELCATSSWVAALPAKLAHFGKHAPKVVVAGSVHRKRDDGRWVNEATVFVHGRRLGTHSKCVPFKYSVQDAAGGGSTEFEEHIARGEEIRLYLCNSGLPFSTLICKDFLSEEIVWAFAHLRVKLMLVPAYSEKTDTLVGSGVWLANHAQAVTVIATPPSGGAAHAQLRCRPVIVTIPSPRETKTPPHPTRLPARAFLGVYRLSAGGGIRYVENPPVS